MNNHEIPMTSSDVKILCVVFISTLVGFLFLYMALQLWFDTKARDPLIKATSHYKYYLGWDLT